MPDPQWSDAQYNPRAAVPEHPAWFGRWRGESDHWRRALACELDLPYGASAGERLDVFPSDGPSRAVLSFVHGGYWRSLDKADFSFIASAFVPLGVTVVVPNYDLCPGVSIEDIVRQMLAAHAWIHGRIADFGGDPERIFVAGHSAGGHLAAMLALAQWPDYLPGLPADLVKGVLSISGIHDVVPLLDTSMNVDFRLDEAAALKVSPVTYRPTRRVPVYAAVGSLESAEFRRQTGLLEERWPECVRETLEVPDRHHFSVVDALVESDNVLHATARRMLAA